MKERVQTVIDEVLRPLLEADGGGVDLLHVGPTRVSLRLRGKAAYSVGGRYIRTLVIEPLLRKASGVPDLEVVLEDEGHAAPGRSRWTRAKSCARSKSRKRATAQAPDTFAPLEQRLGQQRHGAGPRDGQDGEAQRASLHAAHQEAAEPQAQHGGRQQEEAQPQVERGEVAAAEAAGSTW
jgi:hypothetical protein